MQGHFTPFRELSDPIKAVDGNRFSCFREFSIKVFVVATPIIPLFEFVSQIVCNIFIRFWLFSPTALLPFPSSFIKFELLQSFMSPSYATHLLLSLKNLRTSSLLNLILSVLRKKLQRFRKKALKATGSYR